MGEAPPPVLAIDPGLGKCGLAVVHLSGEAAEHFVVARKGFLEAVQDLIARYRPGVIVIGNRTGSAASRAELEPAVSERIVIVEEHETTLRARDRYFKDHPPRGWRAVVPRGLLSPPRAIDDYAAVLLGEEYWKTHPR
jgi:RNase H-fold protein (predicted Holliday junction resolvase)